MFFHKSVPWHRPGQWREMGRALFDALGPQTGRIRTRAREIGHLLDTVSLPLEHLCQAACPQCRDVCCQKAVIWYDFCDLAVYFSLFDRLPGTQIGKIQGPAGQTACMHLTPSGCRLPRKKRPFVCTWYVCPALKQAAGSRQLAEIEGGLKRIKGLRNDIKERLNQYATHG